ncbi:fibronectin type III domain-containing protein [Eubacterium sp.]|uniref:fibronectin type III domain-containing protein n=1 Tax=Eubacterium sp. TaxID=142586 RepID=UPI00352164D1
MNAKKVKMMKVKKVISIIIAITLIITNIQVSNTSADTVNEIFVIGGVQYKITSIEKKEAIVVGGQDVNIKWLYVPNTINKDGIEYNVKQIGDSAFKNCMELEEVSLPDELERIGANAFQNDSKITEIKLPENLKKAGQGAFGECSGLTEIEIPRALETVETVYWRDQNGMFRGCSNLKNIRFEEGSKKIIDNIFVNCTGLEKVTIPEGIETIGNGAFMGCINVQEVMIPEGVTEIGSNAFDNCGNIKEIDFPETLKTIGNSAFANNNKLEKVRFPDNIERIGADAFQNDSKITEIKLPENLKKAGQGAFGECSGLTEIEIPRALETVETVYWRDQNGMFRGCSNLKNIRFEEGSKKIIDNIFVNCTGLEKVTIPEGIETIGNGAFMGCINVQEVMIPEGVTEIGSNAFDNCGNIKEIDFPETLKTIGNSAFANNNKLEKVRFPDNIERIGADAFQNDSKITEIKLPENLKKAGQGAFGECSGLTEIEIPRALETVETVYWRDQNGMFRGCSNLKNIRFEEGSKKIIDNIFVNCTGLEKVTIPEGIETIGNGAFSDCGNLTEIIIPESVMKIGEWAFSGCKNLKFVNIMSEVNELKRGVFADCTELSKLNIGDSIEKINGEAFKNVNDVVAYVNKYSKSMFTFIDKNINVQFKNTIDQSNNDSILRKEKTTYFVNSVTPDGQVALNIDFYLKNNALENSEERQLKVKLPLKYSIKGIKYNNKILDTSEFTISTDNVVTLPIEEENGRYTIYTNLGKSCLISSYAKLEYKKQNKLYNENIGAISEKCFNISFDTSDEINFSEGESKVKTLIRGEGPKNENVDVYVDGKLDKSINISKTGRFETNVELLNPEAYKEYDIEIKSTSADGKQKVVSKKVTTLLDCPKLIEASLYIEAHEYKNGYNEFNILNADKIKYITFQPGKNYNFKIKYKNREKISHVYVISNRDGEEKKLEAKWNEKEKAYITEGFFGDDARYVPGNLSIIYTNKLEEKTKVNSDSSIELSKFDKLNIPEQWKNAEAKQVKDSDSDYEANITLGSGDEINYKFDKLSFDDYAEELQGELNKSPSNSLISMYSNDENEINTHLSDKDIKAIGDIIKTINMHSGDSASYTNDVYDALTKYGFEKYVTGERDFVKDLLMMKTEVTPESIITYMIDPSSNDNCIYKYVVKQANKNATSSVCKAIGIDKTLVGYAANDMFATATFGVDCFDLMTTKMDIYMNPNLTLAQKQAKSAQLQKMAAISFEKLMFTYLSNAIGITAYMCAGTGVGVGLSLALLALNYYVLPSIESGDFDDYLQGKISLSDLFLKWIIDPSGYVYEGVTNNRISGVKTTIYYKNDLKDEKPILWNADEYDQYNPIVTDDSGSYAWDVPEGYWQVKAEKAGYETTYSEWLQVPPIQTNVLLKMKNLNKPSVINFKAYETFAIIEFDQYMNPETVKNMTITDKEGKVIESNLSYDTEEKDSIGNVYAKEYRVDYSSTKIQKGDEINLYASDEILNSDGIAINERHLRDNAKSDIMLECIDYLYLGLNTEHVIKLNTNGSTRDNIKIYAENNNIVAIGELLEANDKNNYEIQVFGKINGDTNLHIEIEGTNIEKIVPIYVGSSTEEGKLKKETIVVPIKNDSKYIINDNSNDSNQVTSEETNVNKRKDDRNKAENQVINSEHNNEQVSIETEKKLCDIQNTSIVKISRRKKSLIIYWKKAKNVSGYQIQYGLTKKCKGKRVNVKVGKKCSKKINKLRPNIRYYFRIRTYVVKNNITYYSKWSKVKKKKTK